MQFEVVKSEHASAAARFTEEFRGQFESAWNIAKANPEDALKVSFSTAKERDTWFDTAKAFGLTHAEKIYVSRVKGTGSMDAESKVLMFRMERVTERDKRIADQRKKAEEAKKTADAKKAAAAKKAAPAPASTPKPQGQTPAQHKPNQGK